MLRFQYEQQWRFQPDISGGAILYDMFVVCHDCSPANQPLELGNTTFKKSKFEETINRKQYYYNIIIIIIILLLYIIIYDYLATIGYKNLIICMCPSG